MASSRNYFSQFFNRNHKASLFLCRSVEWAVSATLAAVPNPSPQVSPLQRRLGGFPGFRGRGRCLTVTALPCQAREAVARWWQAVELKGVLGSPREAQNSSNISFRVPRYIQVPLLASKTTKHT